MAGACDIVFAFEDGVAGIFFEWTHRRFRCGISDGVVRAVIGVGAVDHVVGAVAAEYV